MSKFRPPPHPGLISKALHSVVSQIPASTERVAANPLERAAAVGKSAALKAAAISGSFSLPIGPLGLATVIPDLIGIWKIQAQMVADIAAIFGKTDQLTREAMVICLFKHGGVALSRGLFGRAGNDVVVQRIANRTLQQLLEKIAIRVTQRIAAKSVARWVPIVGALGAGAYAYYDTTQVAANALELLGRNAPTATEPKATPTPTHGRAETATLRGERRSSKSRPRATRKRSRKTTRRRSSRAST
jgi:hypothetical protein